MKNLHTIQLLDTHAGGDVSRIVTGGIDTLPGATVRQQMEYLRDDADGLRRLLLEEPYGIPEMSVDLLVPATDPEAVAGYIIMEVMGYPIYSGSNTLCTATAVLETGIVPTINTGIAHRDPGVGQVGAGVVRAPLACFESALRALAARLGVS